MKIWAKIRNDGEYHSHNIAHASEGFRYFGKEIIKYQELNEILPWVSKNDIVLDYISAVQNVFYKFGLEIMLEDYPFVLQPFMGRRFWYDTITNISASPEKWNIFIKPVKEKAFQGRVVHSLADLAGCSPQGENLEILCSEIIDIKSEWRGFIKYDDLIDIRPYTGDWHYTYDPKQIDKMMAAFLTWKERPMGCSIDFAVIEKMDGKKDTIFLELNDGYALGNYGLAHWDYAKLISARWAQIMNRFDELQF